ncbi:unnamed protein product [Calypogeia fissa]
MTTTEHDISEAKDGTHYELVRDPKRAKRFHWKCIVPGCPSIRTFGTIDGINKHWLSGHPAKWLVQLRSVAGGRGNSECKLDVLKAQGAYFPWRWQEDKNSKLAQYKKVVVGEFLIQQLRYLQQGRPPEPGPVPHLVLAFEAMSLPYLDGWECLKHPQFRVWFGNHVLEVLLGAEYSEFRAHMHDRLASSEVIGRDTEKSLRITLAAVNGKNDEIGRLWADALPYIERAEKHFWYTAFNSNPAEEVHQAVLMRFYDWRFSDAGRERKKKVGQLGIAYRQRTLPKYDIVEDKETSMRSGRFDEAGNDDSDGDEQYVVGVAAFRVQDKVHNFVKGNPLLRGHELLEWARKFPVENIGESTIQVQTTHNLGSLQWELRFQSYYNNCFGVNLASDRHLAGKLNPVPEILNYKSFSKDEQ